MKKIYKEYEKPFVLEPTKLVSLINTIHERLGEHARATSRDHFEVFLSGNRREELSNIEAVLALENSLKQKIQRLLITSSAGEEGGLRAEHEIQVDFGALKTNPTAGSKSTKVIAVSVRSNQSGWASGTLSEVEEQVERTWQRYTPSILVILAILGSLMLTAIFQFVPLNQNLSFRHFLNDADVDRLAQILKENQTMTVDEEREMTTRQYRNILEDMRPSKSQDKGRTKQLLIFGGLLLILIPCGVTLLVTCYPSTVFLWGDETDRYAAMLDRRKALWGIILAVTVTGIGGTLLERILYL